MKFFNLRADIRHSATNPMLGQRWCPPPPPEYRMWKCVVWSGLQHSSGCGVMSLKKQWN